VCKIQKPAFVASLADVVIDAQPFPVLPTQAPELSHNSLEYLAAHRPFSHSIPDHSARGKFGVIRNCIENSLSLHKITNLPTESSFRGDYKLDNDIADYVSGWLISFIIDLA
jgi:hypothetical protein